MGHHVASLPSVQYPQRDVEDAGEEDPMMRRLVFHVLLVPLSSLGENMATRCYIVFSFPHLPAQRTSLSRDLSTMATDKHVEIKTMKLYSHLDRIERRLKMAQPEPQDAATTTTAKPLDPELLGTMDCLHFFGDEPIVKVQRLIEARGGRQARVLDIGTGYGGSARLLAHRTGCRVDALELQPDLSEVAQELTKRCGLDDRVTHLTGDFLLRPVEEETYDVVMGLLCFLHIGKWRELFTRCLKSLKPGGVIYVEDFFQKGASFSQDEHRILKNDVYCEDLITQTEMITLLREQGFECVEFSDVTAKWTPYVVTRTETFDAQLDKHIEVDGEDAAKALSHFYSAVARVFTMGNLGGYTLVARRPLRPEDLSEATTEP